jgi:hypothetical protein
MPKHLNGDTFSNHLLADLSTDYDTHSGDKAAI